MTRVWLFVYGSLRRGGLHHAELKGAVFVGTAETEPRFALITLGDYLALVPASGSRASVSAAAETEADGACVPGELFEVPAALLPQLDEFEGPNYERAELRVRRLEPSGQASEELVSALAYFLKSR